MCAVTFATAAEAWTEVRTRNFVLVGDAGEKELRQCGAKLEQFRETFRTLFPAIRLDGGVRTNVVVFRDDKAYAAFKPKRADGTVDGGVAGYFQAGEDVNYITLSAGERSGSYATVYHEYVHFLLDVNIGRSDLPPWLGEGLTEYFETLQVLDDGRVVLGTPPAGHLNGLRQSDLIPLDLFFATDNAALHRGGDESRSLFYAQAWALTHYLLHGKGANGNPTLSEIFAAARNADTSEKIYRELFKFNSAELANALREYVDLPVPPARILPASRKASTEFAAASATIGDAQAAAYLGDLLHHTGRSSEAEEFLRKALKLDGDLPLANMSLGLILAERKEFAEAEKLLEKAVRVDKSNHFAYFNYAYALSRESTDSQGNVSEFPPETEKKMTDALKRAIELNPGFAESYRLLAFVHFVGDTDLDEAVGLLDKGLMARPGDQHINLLKAQVLLRQEKFEEAEAIAKKLSATASDADIWAATREILRTVDLFRALKTAGKPDETVAKIFGSLPPLILKRSAVSDSDVLRYEEDRSITNLNRYIDRPGFGEKQAVGYLEKITCRDGEITYAVRAGDERFNLVSDGFAGVGLKILTEGERSFTLDCGAAFGKQLTVLTFRPFAGVNLRGRLLSIAFVPDIFRLKTPEEMAAWRIVIIEDDTVFKSRSGKSTRLN